MRAEGKIPTGATYIRDFVLNHPEYKKDSIVTDTITFDLMEKILVLNETKDTTERERFLGKGWKIY